MLSRLIFAACLAAATSAAAQTDSIAASTCQFSDGHKAMLSDRSPDTYFFVMQTGADANLLARIFINDDQTISVAVQGQEHEDPAQSRAIEVLFQELRIMPRQQVTRTQFQTYLRTAQAPACELPTFRDYYPR